MVETEGKDVPIGTHPRLSYYAGVDFDVRSRPGQAKAFRSDAGQIGSCLFWWQTNPQTNLDREAATESICPMSLLKRHVVIHTIVYVQYNEGSLAL